MFRTETKKASIAHQWIADGYHVHALALGGTPTLWIKGSRRYSETEQSEARLAIAALCAEICEGAE
jgi:hypothetical protein